MGYESFICVGFWIFVNDYLIRKSILLVFWYFYFKLKKNN